MAKSSATDDQAITLPSGGGAISALGSTFETNLNTGTGGYEVPLNLPAGPNGIRPGITLRYHSAASNGSFGMGWTMGLLTIARQTDGYLPTYAPDDDRFVIVGNQELIKVGEITYRPRVDTLFWSIRRQGDGWELTDTKGTKYFLGSSPAGRVETVEGGVTKTAMWLLEQMVDTNGNNVSYSYLADGAQRYLQSVTWGTYQLLFQYESRPDKLKYGRFGFLIETKLRCSEIDLNITTQRSPLVRSWSLQYYQAFGTSLSLLSRVTLHGHDAAGNVLDSPPLTLGYTRFQTRQLERIEGPVAAAVPASFAGGRVEPVDWNGDGLPDLVELTGSGTMRIWLNSGGGKLNTPVLQNSAPALTTFDRTSIAFADMDGNGTADLIVLDRPLGGYYPLREGGTFDRPVYWDQAPTNRLVDAESRLVDLDGDGIIDLLVTSPDFVTMYFRIQDGWSERPVTIPREEAPPVSLSDPRVFLADVTGDGLQDLVRVTGAGVTYWQYLGNGRWTPPVQMQNAPQIPRNFDPRRLFLTDIDGDGCADVVYVADGQVSYWFNQSGNNFSSEQVVKFTPFGRPEQLRLVDMNGSGTAGILWSAVPVGNRIGYFYLDLMGGVKPYLLTVVDNGIGSSTTIEYSPSTQFALEDAAVGHPWRTFHPVPTQCVARVTTLETTTRIMSVTDHHYHEARYDGELKVFAGFAGVDVDQLGDASIPTLRVHNVYHIGLDPNDFGRVLDDAERQKLAALQGRLLRSEAYGLDGTTQSSKPFTVVSHEYDVQVVPTPNGSNVYVPKPVRTLTENWERGDSAFSFQEKQYVEIDDNGNLVTQRMRAWRQGLDTVDQDVTTSTTFAKNDVAHIVSLPARVTQRDADGVVLSASLTLYDGAPHVGLPEGQVDIGNVTRRETLVLTDALATAIYGDTQPDWSTLGYFRHPAEDGWWIRKVSYERIDTPDTFSLISRNPRGFDTRLDYDATRQYPLRLTDAASNVTQGTPNERAMQMGTLTDANGQTTSDGFDALARLVSSVSPGDTSALPTKSIVYQTAELPVSTVISSRVNSLGTETIDRTQYYDGMGRLLADVAPGEGDAGREFIISSVRTYNARGSVAAESKPFYSNTQAYGAPPAEARITNTFYDALGRVTRQVGPSGATVVKTYVPGSVDISNVPRSLSVPSKHVVQHFDARRRVIRVEYPLSDRTIAATYEYDAQDRIIRVLDPVGAETRMAYDLVGNMLLEAGVDTGTTIVTVDANSNIRSRLTADGKIVNYEIDPLDRLLSVSQLGGNEADARYSYLDAGSPLPADGLQNRLGRVYQIQDRLGTLTYRYDALGRISQSTREVSLMAGQSFTSDIVYDALGRVVQTTLPEITPGAGRRVVNYHFDARGALAGAPDVVDSAEYDVDGHLTHLTFSNGAEEVSLFDPLTNRLQRRQVLDAQKTIVSDQTYDFDETGNLLGVTSPDPVDSGTFTYDALDRLTSASYGSGDNYSYTYGDSGNIVSNSELGPLTYGGAPGSGAVTGAAGNAYTYDAAGRLASGPFGALEFDALDQLTHVKTQGAQDINLTYDFNGTRVVKTVDGIVTQLIADGSVEIQNGIGVLWIPFGQRKILALAGESGTYVHTDFTGSPTVFTDLAGTVVRRLAFAPYGSLRFDSAAGAGLPDGVRFRGNRLDPETGLICMGRRYYDPRLGRLTSPDRMIAGIFLLDSLNRYVYAHNNPLRYSDQTGLSSNALSVILAGVLVGLAVSIISFGVAGAFGAALGVSISVSEETVVTVTVGEVSNSVMAGLSANRAGGDVLLGMFLGALVGGVTAFAAGAAAVNVLGYAGKNAGGYILSGIISGQIAGAGTGAAIGFAGGKGSLHSIYAHIAQGVSWGTVSGLMLGYVAYQAASRPWLQALTLNKVNLGTAEDAVDLADRPVGFGLDVGATASSGNPANMFSDVIDFSKAETLTPTIWQSGNPFNGAVINIPIDWVPIALTNYGGISGVVALSIGLDDFGVFSYANQITMGLGMIPIIGWLPTLFDAADPGWWHKGQDRTEQIFSMHDTAG